MAVLTDTFVEIDVPATPVRVFEPIQLELSDHSVLQVVRVDHRVSAQIGDFLANIDVPTHLDGRELVDHVRRSFDVAKATVASVSSALNSEDATAVSLSIDCGPLTTVISCTNNV